ncbi:MAG: hypothetical protein ABSA39_17745 [Edaphobacter sp.]
MSDFEKSFAPVIEIFRQAEGWVNVEATRISVSVETGDFGSQGSPSLDSRA